MAPRDADSSRPPHDGGAAASGPDDKPREASRTLDSRELLGPEGVVHIEHQGERYTLRRTRNGRLILTK